MRVIHSADALVGDFRKHPGSRVVFFCNGCNAPKSYDPQRIIDRLRERRLGGYNTPIREVGRFARMTCPKCGATGWNTQLAYPPNLDEREAKRLANRYRN